ncbi:hypothetical protein MD484_g3165, partial [Candolleomyces efflorescens]
MIPIQQIADFFVQSIQAMPDIPGVDLNPLLSSATESEAELRRLFVADRNNPLLDNAHLGLVNVYDAPESIRKTRARVWDTEEDLQSKFLFPLLRRRAEGMPTMANHLNQFKLNFADFTQNVLSGITWDNIVVAGGCVTACLSPTYQAGHRPSQWSKYIHSDVDIFLYGLNPEQAEAKMNEIFEAIEAVSCNPPVCVRTKHAVTVYSEFPCRPVQVVLRLYRSLSEVLTGFDIDACCFGFDGQQVWASPRAIIAMMRECNTVDLTRRSPSYEVRLAKYAERGFEVFVPHLERARIDKEIYNHTVFELNGLARLLLLESVFEHESVDIFGHLEDVRPDHFIRGQYKGDERHEKGVESILELSDYDQGLQHYHIPFGPGWTATRVAAEVLRKVRAYLFSVIPSHESETYTQDVWSNFLLARREKIHRHVAFVGTMVECLEDCCRRCPVNGNYSEQDRKTYIYGRVEYASTDNPGRQSLTGSFHPIFAGEWCQLAYAYPVNRAAADGGEGEAPVEAPAAED